MTKSNRLRANHEAAHAVAMMHFSGPVQRISITPGAGYAGYVRGSVGWQPWPGAFMLNMVVVCKVGVIGEALAKGQSLARAWRPQEVAWCLRHRWDEPGSDISQVRRHLNCIVQDFGELQGKGEMKGVTWDSSTTTTAVWLVESHALAIEAIANALLASPTGTLTGKEARAIAREALGKRHFGTVR